ncbi:MAG: peptide chain release factor 1, partial [Myxococcota bacterium]
LDEIESRFSVVLAQMADPDVVSNVRMYRDLASEHRNLTPIVEAWQELRGKKEEIDESQVLLKDDDPDMRQMAKEELDRLRPEVEKLEADLRLLMLPKDPNDEKNVILEIRAGTGGDEAALFAADVFRMYSRYADSQGWRIEVLTTSENDIGGIKEISCAVSGDLVYHRMKYESGVHRVQRVPTTETQGRIHTSACTVAILPEADEIEVNIPDNEIRIDTFRSSGAGGQHVNVTDSAIRVTHIPTNIVVSCQDEKSQHKNKAKALKVLRARILEKLEAAAHAERAADRRSQVGTGDRSERIRTYNYPQNRVSDHRINLTLYKLDQITMGALDQVIDPLIEHDQAEMLKGQD